MLDHREVAAGGDHHVAEPRAYGGRDRRRTSRGRSPRRGSAPRPAPRARSRQAADARRRPRRRGSRGAGTGPRRRAARRRRSSSGCVVDVEPALRRRVDHAVVGDHERSGRRGGSASRSCSASASIIDSCCCHWRRRDAVPVPGPVEVAVVQVGQRRRRAGRPATAAAIRSPTLSAPTNSAPRCAGDGQPGAGELPLVDDGRCTPAAAQPGERGRVRLPLAAGRPSLLHSSALSSSSVPGIREVKPTRPCVPGRQRRCPARSGWSRSSTAPRRSPGCCSASSECEVRRLRRRGRASSS